MASTIIPVFVDQLITCEEMNQPKDLNRLQDLSEKTGIEMVVIDEAETIAGVQAEHFKRWLISSIYVGDSIKYSIQQHYPRTKTVLLPGISFLLIAFWQSKSLTA